MRARTRLHPPYNKLKGFLKSNAIGYKEVAEVLNCSLVSVSLKINGQSDFSMREVNAFCDEYNCTAEIFRP